MPKVYLTIEEKKKAEVEKKNRLENAYVGSELEKAMKNNGVRYEDICKKTAACNGTISKAIHNPQQLPVDRLREILFAAGLRLVIDVEHI